MLKDAFECFESGYPRRSSQGMFIAAGGYKSAKWLLSSIESGTEASLHPDSQDAIEVIEIDFRECCSTMICLVFFDR